MTADGLIDKYSNETITSGQNYADIADWLTPEEQYSYRTTDNSDNIADIYNPIFFVKSDRIYYETRIDNLMSFSYIALKTGESFSLCPDPLCDHTPEGGCKYLSLHQMMFSKESDDVFYSVKTTLDEELKAPVSSICRIDAKKGTINEIFNGYLSEINILRMLTLRLTDNNRLYFTAIREKSSKVTDGIIEREYEETLMSVNLTTYEVSIVDNKYKNKEHGEYFFTDGKYIYFIDAIVGRLFATDMNFENETTVLEYGNEYTISSFYYDADTSETYICVHSRYMMGWSETEIEDGNIYCIDKNLNYSKLDMPSDKILEFQLTNEYIYYTVYDPVFYGETPYGVPCMRANGNKIYRIQRGDTAEGELVFDGREKLHFRDYMVTGDFLYINYVKLFEDQGFKVFRITGLTARVDMENDAVKWFNLNNGSGT
ncbi:MAG: hypothetical protein PHZ09_02855 [Eubacteriales bacterium]|nr:hypothetical protein [Eubacteriales bacterium]